ncbi:major facilitator superfamily domain-containing protein 3-like [Saccoglossus kowalevskii]|uniref:Major facilitator superfamily domain-containing protein 3-like n=1 Tax=Saccoglossus kowalevskii TaxID=10224 RepID=A0ABM0GX60_SACKO|nr:PREDICTED: major facilitator superfamily domain-containing protein 3-like [Saccoglossus kowalevskii]
MKRKWAFSNYFLYRNSNISILALLYFVQGIPYGFQARFLPVYLRQNRVSLTNLGFIKLLLVPWLLKVLWAPLVDRWGTKHSWLVYSICGLAVVCLAGAFIDPNTLPLLCVVIFLLNLCAATQDIAVDGIAISLLGEEDLGIGNTAQVVGYKFGSIIGGGLLIWLIEHIGWFGLFINLACLYFVTLWVISRIPELKSNNTKQNGNRHEEQPLGFANNGKNGQIKIDKAGCLNYGNIGNVESESGTFTCSHTALRNGKKLYKYESTSTIEDKHRSDRGKLSHISRTKSNINELDGCLSSDICDWVSRIGKVPGTAWLFVYVLTYKLGEQGANGMFPLFLVDYGMSAGSVGLWTGVIGQSLSILGSLLGGYILSCTKCRPISMLQVLFILRLLPLFIMNIIIWSFQDKESTSFFGMSVFSMCLLQFIGGVITTATFTLMMRCSQDAPKNIQATHWTACATMEVLGKLSFMSFAGILTDYFEYSVMFTVFSALSVAVIPHVHNTNSKI